MKRNLLMILTIFFLFSPIANALTINWPFDEGSGTNIAGPIDTNPVSYKNATLDTGSNWVTEGCKNGNCYYFSGEQAVIYDACGQCNANLYDSCEEIPNETACILGYVAEGIEYGHNCLYEDTCYEDVICHVGSPGEVNPLHLANWTSFTVCSWINKTTQNGYIISDSHSGFMASLHSFEYNNDDFYNASSTVIDDGLWHHICSTYNGTALKLYHNGVLDGVTMGTSFMNGYDGNTCIGGNCAEGGIEDKILDGLFVLDTALSDEEILAVYEYDDGYPTTTEATTTTSSSELSSSSSEQSSSSVSSFDSSSSSVIYASTSSSSYYSSSSQLASTSSSAISSSSSSMGSSMDSSSTSSVISSTLVTTTLLNCEGDYTLACFILNETVCGDYFTTYEYEHYQCIWDVDYCGLDEDGCALDEMPPCNDYEVEDCETLESEESCEQSYYDTGGPETTYNCQWIFGYCYAGYQECEIILNECPSEYIYGCPLINNSRDCPNYYSVFDGYYYECYWEEEAEWCWFGPNCEKSVFDQCPGNVMEDCYEIENQTTCDLSYVEGREDFGWNCVWYDGYCYYAQDCHIGSPVTTTIPGAYDDIIGFMEEMPSLFKVLFILFLTMIIIVGALMIMYIILGLIMVVQNKLKKI